MRQFNVWNVSFLNLTLRIAAVVGDTTNNFGRGGDRDCDATHSVQLLHDLFCELGCAPNSKSWPDHYTDGDNLDSQDDIAASLMESWMSVVPHDGEVFGMKLGGLVPPRFSKAVSEYSARQAISNQDLQN